MIACLLLVVTPLAKRTKLFLDLAWIEVPRSTVDDALSRVILCSSRLFLRFCRISSSIELSEPIE